MPLLPTPQPSLPTPHLDPNALYTATVTTGATDLAGNPLGAGLAPNPWTFTTAATPDTTAPTIISTNPVDAAANVAINATVNATFSEAMDPLTITTATFQLEGPGAVAIPGTVTYDPINFIATFTPSSNLVAGTTYTATITAGATDLAGNPLGAGVASNPWSFTTVAAVLPAVNLGTAATFGTFGGGAGMTNQGLLTVINGDIATTGASTLVTGFHDNTVAGTPPPCSYTETPLNKGTVNGGIYTAPPPPTVGCPSEGTSVTMAIATQAAADTLTAFNATSAAQMPPTVAAQAAELGGSDSSPGRLSIRLGHVCDIERESYPRRPGKPQCGLGFPNGDLPHRRHCGPHRRQKRDPDQRRSGQECLLACRQRRHD